MNSAATESVEASQGENHSVWKQFVHLIFGPGAFLTVGITLLLGHLVLGYWHIGQMILKPHYQYVLLLPFAVWLLSMRQESSDISKIPEQPGHPLIVLVGFLFNLLLIGGATYIWSPWVGGVSAVCSILLLIYWYGGKRLVKIWLPGWIFCWTAIPLPFQMDENLTTSMKSFSTIWASRFLDEFGIMHLRYSNVIELPDKQLFVADACSGIHSLFVLIAAGLFIALWNHRSFLHVVLLLGMSFFLAIVENISRLLIVAFSWTQGLDLTEGRPHEVLGFALFAVTVLLLLSADQLLKAILPSKDFYSEVYALFQKTILRRTRSTKKRSKEGSHGLAVRKIPWPGMLLVCWAFPVLGAVQMARIPSEAPNISKALTADLDLERLDQEVMPKEISGYNLIDFKFVKRVEGDPLGKNSEVWEFKKGNITFKISRDWPYEEVHDLCHCYYNTGWTITTPRVIHGKGTPKPFVEATLARNLYGSNYLLFSQCNEEGQFGYGKKPGEQIGRPDDDEKNQIVNKLQSLFGKSKNKVSKSVEGPFFQVHLIARSATEPSDEQKNELKMIYDQLRDQLVNLTIDKK